MEALLQGLDGNQRLAAICVLAACSTLALVSTLYFIIRMFDVTVPDRPPCFGSNPSKVCLLREKCRTYRECGRVINLFSGPSPTPNSGTDTHGQAQA